MDQKTGQKRADLIADRILGLRKSIGKAKLLVVSKYSPEEDIRFAHLCGHRDFGENRVQDIKDKSQLLSDLPDIRWHFIGNLQSNKVKLLFNIPGLNSIHSVDSLKLLQALYEKVDLLEERRKPIDLFLQVNTSGEDEKSGFKTLDDLSGAINFISKQGESKLKFAGLMTMGKIRTEDFENDARASFKKLVSFGKSLQHDFELPLLLYSMGMSQDYGIALEEGSHWVRIGSQIFK